jgi:hypothetical protein
VSHVRFGLMTADPTNSRDIVKGVRLTRMDLDPPRVDEAISDYEDDVLPWLVEMDGLSSALFLVHRRTGGAIMETLWRDQASLQASRSAAASIHSGVVAATDGIVRALEEFELSFTSASY